jgi:hypothetical protein
MDGWIDVGYNQTAATQNVSVVVVAAAAAATFERVKRANLGKGTLYHLKV